MSQKSVPIVIDNGSFMCKVGFAGDDTPRGMFRSVVGRPRDGGLTCVGSEALSRMEELTVSCPIGVGLWSSWDDMEALWRHAFSTVLKANSKEHPVLLTELPLSPVANRERMAEMMFESFDAPKMAVARSAPLCLYAGGLTTGTVFESGDSVSHVLPIYDGYVVDNAILRLYLAGRHLNEYLAKMLTERGYPFRPNVESELVRSLKEQFCHVALDFAAAAAAQQQEKSYELPGGKVVTIGDEQFRCPELLFDPTSIGMDLAGIHQTIYDSISRCDSVLRKTLAENIVLSGGNTMFKGIAERLEKELTSLAPQSWNVAVKATPERKYAVWIGGSVLASLSGFQPMWIDRKEYDESGVAIVRKKTF